MKVQIEAKQKKEEERLLKMAEKEKEKEEKAKAEGKKKADDGGVVPTSSMVDQNSHMVGGAHSGMKRKAVLNEYSEDVVTQGTQIIALGDDEEVNSEELILNVSIMDIVDNETVKGRNCYTEVMDFLKKVLLEQ